MKKSYYKTGDQKWNTGNINNMQVEDKLSYDGWSEMKHRKYENLQLKNWELLRRWDIFTLTINSNNMQNMDISTGLTADFFFGLGYLIDISYFLIIEALPKIVL